MEINFKKYLNRFFMKRLLEYNSIQSKKRYLFFNDPEMIDENINQLPSQIRNKIYIMSIRNYWRKYIPLTAKVPSWYTHSIDQKKMLLNAMLDNIHFMHLPCNTLEENKTYILGCQCSYCKYYGLDRGYDGTNSENKYNHRQLVENNYIDNTDYFIETIPRENNNSRWNSRWKWICSYNEDNYVETVTMGMKIYNPGEDIFLTIKDKINGPPIHFT